MTNETRRTYVYLFGTSVKYVYKIGIAYTPNKRINSCYKCINMINVIPFENRSEAWGYERALHTFYWNCRANSYGIREFNSEYFVMTLSMVDDLALCDTEDDLNMLMGISNQYIKAKCSGKDYRPTFYVKPILRWYEIEHLIKSLSVDQS